MSIDTEELLRIERAAHAATRQELADLQERASFLEHLALPSRSPFAFKRIDTRGAFIEPGIKHLPPVDVDEISWSPETAVLKVKIVRSPGRFRLALSLAIIKMAGKILGIPATIEATGFGSEPDSGELFHHPV